MRYNNKLGPTDDINDIIISGIYPYYVENGFPQNMPNLLFVRGNLIVFRSEYHTTQLILDSAGLLCFRTKINLWEQWFLLIAIQPFNFHNMITLDFIIKIKFAICYMTFSILYIIVIRRVYCIPKWI